MKGKFGRTVNFTNYNEQNVSDYDSLYDNFVPMIENTDTNEIAPQNMDITIGKTKCKVLFDSSS